MSVAHRRGVAATVLVAAIVVPGCEGTLDARNCRPVVLRALPATMRSTDPAPGELVLRAEARYRDGSPVPGAPVDIELLLTDERGMVSRGTYRADAAGNVALDVGAALRREPGLSVLLPNARGFRATMTPWLHDAGKLCSARSNDVIFDR